MFTAVLVFISLAVILLATLLIFYPKELLSPLAILVAPLVAAVSSILETPPLKAKFAASFFHPDNLALSVTLSAA